MAYLLSLKKSWLRKTPLPHYPITASRRAQAISYGAVEVGPEKVKEFIKKYEEAHV